MNDATASSHAAAQPAETRAGWQRAALGAGLLNVDGSPTSTIFDEMSALARQTGAVNLGQGFPDGAPPELVSRTAQDAIARGINQYPPGRGAAGLRAAVADHRGRRTGHRPDPDREILITAGATEGLAATLLGLLAPGDEVITLSPSYDAYGALIALAGGVERPVPLTLSGFRPDLAAIEAACAVRTTMILINTPHNPTGTVFTAEEIDNIVALAEKFDAWVVVDEVYEELSYGAAPTAVAARPGAWSRTISVSSAGKAFEVTGWKIGWVVAPAAMIDRIMAVKQVLTFSGGAPFQSAIAAGLNAGPQIFEPLRASLRSRRNVLVAGLRGAGFTAEVPESGYFVVADAAPLGVIDAAEFCRSLPGRCGVVAVPVSAFGGARAVPQWQSLVRFAFCKSADDIDVGVARLGREFQPGA